MPRASSRKGVCRSLRWLRLRGKHWLPQALRILRICPRSQPRSVQASAAIARSRQFAPEKVCSSIEALHVLNRSAKLSAGLMSVNRGVWLLLSVSIYRFSSSVARAALYLQRWYASPFKYKARLRLHERGLTLPSSGRAFGTPLKSNVRVLSVACCLAACRCLSLCMSAGLRALRNPCLHFHTHGVSACRSHLVPQTPSHWRA